MQLLPIALRRRPLPMSLDRSIVWKTEEMQLAEIQAIGARTAQKALLCFELERHSVRVICHTGPWMLNLTYG
jgi:hypothetical protein